MDCFATLAMTGLLRFLRALKIANCDNQRQIQIKNLKANATAKNLHTKTPKICKANTQRIHAKLSKKLTQIRLIFKA